MKSFQDRIKKTNNCWLWQGHCNEKGYGTIHREGFRLAHRYSYYFHNGPFDLNMTVEHLCKVRNCVNPKHLTLLTHSENCAGAYNVNRNKTHCKNGHKFSKDNIYNSKFNIRKCKLCDKMRRKNG